MFSLSVREIKRKKKSMKMQAEPGKREIKNESREVSV